MESGTDRVNAVAGQAGATPPVAGAIQDGLRAVKERSVVSLAGSIILTLLFAAAGWCAILPIQQTVLTEVFATESATGASNSSPIWYLVALLILLVAIVFGVGYGYTMLRASRGEAVGFGSLLDGFRKAPAALLTGLCVVLTWAIGLAVVGLGGSLAAAPFGGLVTSAVENGGSAIHFVTIVMALVVAVVVSLLSLAFAHVATGVSLAPMFAMDADMGVAESVRASWSAMKGRRLVKFSLWLASVSCFLLSLLLVLLGGIVGIAIAVAAYAAFYGRLRSEEALPAAAARRSGIVSWIADLALLNTLVVATWVLVLVASVILVIDVVRTSWPSYGTNALLPLVGWPPVIVVALYIVYSLVRGRPGRHVVGSGWGDYSWLAAGLLVWVLPTLFFLFKTVPPVFADVPKLATGQEMARIVSQDLVAEGYERSSGSSSVEDVGKWLYGSMVVDERGGENAVWSSMAITDTAGAGYDFVVTRYYTPGIEQQVYDHMAGGNPVAVAGLGEAAARADLAEAGLARLVVLDGDAIIAGITDLANAAELETITKQLLDRLPAAISETDEVFQSLSWRPQMLAEPDPTEP